MNEINRERFEAWLFSQPDNRAIEAGNGDRCFLCSFLKETTPYSDSFIRGWFAWTTQKGTDHRAIPVWATRLIEREWITSTNSSQIITSGQMKQRYISLFGDPRIVDEQKGQSNERQTSYEIQL